MAFWTRFLKRKSPLLDAQETPGDSAGVFKKLLGFLVRQKQVWAAFALTILLIIGGTYYAIKIRPYSDLSKKTGLVFEVPPAPQKVVTEQRRPEGEAGEIPEIRQGVTESRAEAEALLRQAEAHYQRGEIDAAKDKLQRSIGLTTDTRLLSVAYANLANLLDGESKYTQALQFLQRALRFDRHFVEGYHNLGVIYLHLHEFDKAQLAFQMAIREKPDFAAAHAGLGEIHSTLGRFPEAVQAYTESLRLREDPSVRLSLGMVHLLSGNHAQAIDEFSAAQTSATDPYTKYLAYFNRAYSLDAKGRFDEAAADYRAALALVSKDVDATFNLGLSLMAAGKKEEALAAFRKVVEMDPDNMDAYLNAVTLHSDLGQYQEALTLLTPVHQRLPTHKRVNYLMAHLYHRVGKLAESHEFFNNVLAPEREEIPPQLKADAMAGLASVLDDSGDLEGAESYYRESIRLGKAPYLYYNLSRTLRRARKLDESVKEATAALEMEPGNYTYVLALAEVLYDAEQLPKAFDVYKQAAEMAPAGQEIYPRFMMAFTASRQRQWSTALSEYNRLLAGNIDTEVRGAVFKGIGNVYHEQAEYTQALAAYKDAASFLPKDSSLFYNIARTYMQLSQLDECNAALQKSLAFNQNSSEAYTLLGTYYFKKGLMDKAYDAFDKAVRINPENLEAYYNRDATKKYQ